MLQYIFANVLMLSLGTILYLFAKTIPRLQEEAGEHEASFLERWVTSEMPHQLDRAISSWAGKLFRKLKVLSLRLDNYLTEKLKKLNTNEAGLTGQVKPKIDLSEVMEVKTEEYTGPDRRVRTENVEGRT